MLLRNRNSDAAAAMGHVKKHEWGPAINGRSGGSMMVRGLGIYKLNLTNLLGRI
jgi:hypothetical protein